MDVVSAVFGNAAMILNALAFWMKDVFWLRIVSITSSVCFVIYSMTVAAGPLWIMVGWSMVFLAINLYRILRRPERRATEPVRAQ